MKSVARTRRVDHIDSECGLMAHVTVLFNPMIASRTLRYTDMPNAVFRDPSEPRFARVAVTKLA